MNSSLPVLPATTARPGLPQSVTENSVINQPKTAQSGEFGALLEGQFMALPEAPEPATAGGITTAELLAELQELPPDGKLLPFLQETLGTGDVDATQLLQQLSARLEALEPAEAAAVVQSLSGLIQQDHSRAALAPLANESLVLAASRENTAPVLSNSVSGLVNQTLRSAGQAQDTSPQSSLSADAALLKQPASGMPPLQTSSSAMDKVMQSLQQEPQSAEIRPSDLAILVSSLRRQQGEASQRAVDPRAVPESASVVGSAVATVTPGASAASSVLPSISIQTPFGQADWDQSVGERIQWMVGQKMQSAQVKLNPANLGPMEVRIQIQNDQASVQFSAHHAGVREALEAALPRLREMFEASGVELVDADVSEQSFAEQQAARDDSSENAWDGGDDAPAADTVPEQLLESEVTSVAATGRLDLFV